MESIEAMGETGALMTWEGQNPQNGLQIRARLFVVFFRKNSVSLFGSGEQHSINTRDPMLRAIFSTLGVSENGATSSSLTSSATRLNPLASQGRPSAPNPLAVTNLYIGVFKNDGMTVELKGGQGQYTGGIQFAGQKFPVAARETGESLEGTFVKSGKPVRVYRIPQRYDIDTFNRRRDLCPGETDSRKSPRTSPAQSPCSI